MPKESCDISDGRTRSPALTENVKAGMREATALLRTAELIGAVADGRQLSSCQRVRWAQ